MEPLPGLLETLPQALPVQALGWQGGHRGEVGAQRGGYQCRGGAGYSHMLPGKVEQGAQRGDGALSEECRSPAPRQEGAVEASWTPVQPPAQPSQRSFSM